MESYTERNAYDQSKLIKAALEVLPRSYAPYSHFNVGAAVLMDNGEMYTGVNIENAAYSATICAERTAIFKAIAADKNAKIVALAVVGGKDYTVTDYCVPCGICRQVMREFAEPDHMQVIVAKSVTDYKAMSLAELLPMSFGPNMLG